MAPPATAPTPGQAPGPRGSWLFGVLWEIRDDPLGFFDRITAEYGDVVRARLGFKPVYLLRHPDDVQRVLEKRNRSFPKETAQLAAMRLVLGRGLVGASGKLWQQQRRTMQPLFRSQALAGFTSQVAALTRGLLAEWRAAAAAGTPVDAAAAMRRLTFTVAGQVLFASDVAGDAEAFAAAMDVIHAQTVDRLFSPSLLPLWVPTPRNRAFTDAVATMDEVVYRLIRAQREAGGGDPEGPLLARLMAAEDPETGERFDDLQLRDQVMTLLLAGHETTSNALAWTWALLARHPEVAAQVRAEAVAALGERDPGADDLPALARARQVFLESLRLYPTTWGLLRTAAEDCEFRGYRVPAGSMLVVSPYATHRHPDFWPDPTRFDPDRFLPEAEEARHRFAHFPFGGGPRSCIGADLAVIEARVILGMVLRDFDVELEPGREVVPQALVSLAPRDGVWLRLRSR